MSLFDIFDGGNSKKASKQLKQALAQYEGIDIPDIEKQRLVMEEYASAGLLTPEMEQAFLQAESEYNSVYADPRLKDAQLSALSKLQEITDNNGLTLQDQANLNKIQGQLRQQEKGQRDAIMQNMAQRGVQGSGLELAAQLSNTQATADRASDEGLNVAAQAQQRALEALMNQNQVAGNIRNQDFSEQSAKAQAQDAINRFNTANRQDVQQRNIAQQNQSKASNLQNKQNLLNQNTALRNQQQQYNKELEQQKYDNKLKLATGKSGGYQNLAQNYSNQSTNNMNFVGGLVSSGAMLAASDENLKEDIKKADFDVEEFLNSLSPKKYQYKEPKKFGEGQQVGIMAQDLEKTDAGKMLVKETDDGKMVDTSKAALLALASLAQINDRLKKVEE
jgi:hypothetical protein